MARLFTTTENGEIELDIANLVCLGVSGSWRPFMRSLPRPAAAVERCSFEASRRSASQRC
jgi:hypothetical protein